MNSLPHKVRVCVVGAGVAGLGAAQRLLQGGMHDILVVEAQDRVGGRICTVKHGDAHIELGAHWIHGEEGNVVYGWAAENGLVADEASMVQTGKGNNIFIRDNEEVVSDDIVDDFKTEIARIHEASEKECTTYPHSLGQYFTEKFKTVNKWGQIGDELLEWEGRFQNCINGSYSWFDVSAKGSLQYKECPGNPVVNWKHGGFQNLILHLKEKLPPSCLLLGSPVKHVEWESGVSSSLPACRVTLASSTVIEADHVIYTPSLGVLKAQANEIFSPPLPDKKMRAIEGLDIKPLGKIFIEFPHRWWSEDCDGFSFLWSAQKSPAYVTKENWEDGLLGFYSVYQQPNMLCGWITGPGTLVMEQTPDEEVGHRCVALLKRLLSSKFEIPDPICCIRSTWGSNPWFRGAYSFSSMKTDALGVTPADLAEPLIDSVNGTPLVCFAGEATHDCFYSTVHGALESGWREADRLIRHFSSGLMHGEGASRKNQKKYCVAIVGAGIAGVGAARELTAQGISSVLILEGSDRIGGRINTAPVDPNGIVELGAQWIHGEVGNALFQFAKSRKQLHQHVSVDGKGNFYMEGGRKIHEDIVQEVSKVMEEADKECYGLNHRRTEGQTPVSVGQVFRKTFSKYLESCVNDSPETKRIKEALFQWNLRWQRNDNACDSLHHLSASCWGSYKFCEGESNMNPQSGFQTLVNTLLDEAAADVKLNSEVECIDYATEVVAERNTFTRPDGITYPVILQCRNGKQYEAQHVLVTPSVGYLKNHPSLFSPQLPKKLHQAIMSRGYGTLDKIFLEYEDPWWEKDCEGIQIVWTSGIPNYEYTQPSTATTENSRQQESDWWIKAITGFDPVFYHKAMLCGWIGGSEAEHMENLCEEEIGQACTKLLRCFLGKNIPIPKRVYRSQWARNHFIQGSYSHHGLDCHCWSGKRYENELNTPVFASVRNGDKVAVLALAGEANSTEFYSTAHGALQNGMTQVAYFVSAQKSHGISGKLRSKV